MNAPANGRERSQIATGRYERGEEEASSIRETRAQDRQGDKAAYNEAAYNEADYTEKGISSAPDRPPACCAYSTSQTRSAKDSAYLRT